MATLTATPRSIKVLARKHGSPSRVRISAGRVVEEYDLASEPVNDGVHVQLTKADGTVYDVLLSPTGNTCDCKGHLRWGHCKHEAALMALVCREQDRAANRCPNCERGYRTVTTDGKQSKIRCVACHGTGEQEPF
jgi:hypothetical protein